jgi:uncharacterized membrane protein YkoI
MNRQALVVCLLAGWLAASAALPAQARRDDWKDDRREMRQDDRFERSARRDQARRGGGRDYRVAQRRDERVPRREESRRDGISLDEAVTRVRRDTGGRVLSAEARDGRYRVKVLLPNGAVRVISVDKRSGRMD